MSIPSRHVELALYADDTAAMATSRKPELLVSYLESFLSDLERWLKEWRIGINVSKSTAMLFTRTRIQKPRPVQLFGETILWVDAARYLGVILDTRLTWSSHIDQVRKKAAQRLGVLGPLLHRRSGLSIRNGVLPYKQLIRPMMDYGCPVWRSAARSHLRKLQVIQSKCFRAATGAPWYISNRQIHEDLGVPFFADHIRYLTESFYSKLAGAGNPLVRQLCRYLTEGWPKSPEAQAKGGDGARLALPLRYSGFTKVPVHSHAFQTMTVPLWVQIPENLPTKVCPPTHVWLIKRNPCIPIRSPKLRRNLVSVKRNPSLSIESLLMSPEMRSQAGMAKQTRGRRLVPSASRRPLVRPLVGWFVRSLVRWLVGSFVGWFVGCTLISFRDVSGERVL
jgi:hypothetical protein